MFVPASPRSTACLSAKAVPTSPSES
jgi:hypothetical protein